MGSPGGKCADCGKPCHGTRCREHFNAAQKAQRDESRAKRSCKDCGAKLSRGNKTGYCLAHRYKNDQRQEPTGERLEADYGRETGTLYSVSSRIKTPEQAMEAAEIDHAEWYADRVTVKKWEVLRRDDAEPVQMFGVTVRLKRKVARAEVDAVEILCERLAKKAPKRAARKYKPSGERVMLEFSPNDAHFGKLAWKRETGEDYDLEIASRVFADALEDTLSFVPQLKGLERFLFPVGSDLLHTDTFQETTTAGTPQDTDGRWAKMWATATLACVKAIDRMAEIAPVEVVWVPGNHDYMSSFHLSAYLSAWYRDDANVSVDLSPSPRKYVRYGINLIGLTHGNEERHAALPGLMAQERPDLWAATRFREWHLGHYHKRKAIQHTAVDTHEGVVVRVLPSLSGRDAWHHRKGYIGCRAAESYLWSRERGYVGHFSANVRDAA